MQRLRNMLRRIARREPATTARRIDREIDEELSFHLEMRTRENVAAGMTAEEARQRARERFGQVDVVRRNGREIRRGDRGRFGVLLDDLRQDVRYALRSMATTPGVTASALLALALGMGATTAVFSVIDGVLLEEMAYTDPERLVILRHDTLRDHYALFENELQSVESIGFFTITAHLVTGIPEPERVSGLAVSENYFAVLDVPAQLGRTLTPADHTATAAPAVVISDRIWHTALAADPAALGRQLLLDDRPFTIVGVMPAGFRSPRYPHREIWLSLSQVESHGGMAVVRRSGDATLERVRVEVQALAAQLGVDDQERAAAAIVTTLYDEEVGSDRPALQLMALAVSMVLFIACANVANLLLARSLARRREISVRAALGASRGRIVRQLLTESGLLAILGGVLGLALAWITLPSLLALSPAYMPRQENIDLDLRVLAFAFLAALVTGVLVGLVPALLAERKQDRGLLHSDRSAGISRSRLFWLDGLVIAEVALALVLIAATGLVLRTFVTLNPTTPGFEIGDRVVFRLWPPEHRYGEDARRTAFFSEVLDGLRARPEIADAAAVTVIPFVAVAYVIDALPEGYDPDAARLPRIWYERASGNYLDTMGIPVLRGRSLAQIEPGEPGAVISQQAARELWPDEEPLGKRLSVQLFDGAREFVVVGVAGDTRRSGAVLRPRATVWVPYADHPEARMWFVVRPRDERAELAAPIREVVRRVDADVPVEELQPLRQILHDSVSSHRFYAALVGAFGLIAVMLAAIGFYSVMSYSVGRRTRELGIRMALGAAPGRLRLSVLRHGLALTCVGVLLGLAGAVAFVRLLEARIYASQPLPALDLAVLAIGFVVLGLIATATPARRATRVDPLIALRQQ